MNSRKPSHDSLRLFRLFRTGSAPGDSVCFPMRWSPWLQSFLYYVPYACLTAMTFPAILTATESPVSAAAALVVAVAVAFAGKGLMTVAVCASVTVFLVERLLPLLSF